MNLKRTALVLIFLASPLFMGSAVLADQYGETDTGKDVTVYKYVLHPSDDDQGEEWKENLFASDYKFNPEQDVHFKVVVKNTGDRDLTGVKMKDILPDYLSYISGDLDKEFDLKKDEEYTFFITARVYTNEDLPDNAGVYCVLNTAQAWYDEDDKDQDTSQVCIRKEGEEGEVLGEMTALPEAGPEYTVALIAGTLILAITGLVLLKKKK